MDIEKVHLKLQKRPPKDYHCKCGFCKQFKGILIRPDGTKYSKTERRHYYEKHSHIAKTPLHIARWAVQEFTKPRQNVFDPTIGSGTTAVEAVIQRRNGYGMDIQYAKEARFNVQSNVPEKVKWNIISGDARDLCKHFKKNTFQLIVNNPPYSGDEQQKGGMGSPDKALYDRKYSTNLAFLKESDEYWETMQAIYDDCYLVTKKNGYFILGVKDMIRNKEPYLLHKLYGEILHEKFMYQYMVLLPHWPPTLFMSTYNKRFPEVKVPRYQTLLIFKKR